MMLVMLVTKWLMILDDSKQKNMKKTFAILFISISNFIFSQSFDNAINFIKQNNTYSESVVCYNSRMLAKAEYYISDNVGYAVMYIKQNDYDIYGKPYIFCNISRDRWSYFKTGGYTSWGESFHQYIKEYICNPQVKNKVSDKTQSQFESESQLEFIRREQLKGIFRERKYSNSQTYYNNPEINVGKFNLNYKYSFGASISNEIFELITTIRLGKKTTLQTQYNRFHKNIFSDEYNDFYKKQFGVSAIYNYNASFFSENLFFITGLGFSYSKSIVENEFTFENKFNPIINLGLDYNFDKIPISLGIHSRLDFGDYSNFGISLKYIYK